MRSKLDFNLIFILTKYLFITHLLEFSLDCFGDAANINKGKKEESWYFYFYLKRSKYDL